MFKKKCRGCAEKVDRKFNYCPHCGASLKLRDEDMGMLGATDSGRIQEELKLPFGVEKIMGSLVKQLEKQLENMDLDDKEGMPKGFKIQIARGPMVHGVVQNNVPKKRMTSVVSREEGERRANLKKTEAESKVKRIGDVIIYEIKAPGIMRKEDVVITELETGIEIRAYAQDRCYVKVIPMKVEILGMRIDREKISVEMRG
jgi:RNA polymerase subunit RPABC4/transcription elongation factor Spt4